MAGFTSDMTAWAPLTAAQPGLLKVIMSCDNKAALRGAARAIHMFWVERRRQGTDVDRLEGQLVPDTPASAAGDLGIGAPPGRLLH